MITKWKLHAMIVTKFSQLVPYVNALIPMRRFCILTLELKGLNPPEWWYSEQGWIQGWGCYPHYEELMPKMKLFCCGMPPEPNKRTFAIYLPPPPPPPTPLQYFIARFQLVSHAVYIISLLCPQVIPYKITIIETIFV